MAHCDRQSSAIIPGEFSIHSLISNLPLTNILRAVEGERRSIRSIIFWLSRQPGTTRDVPLVIDAWGDNSEGE